MFILQLGSCMRRRFKSEADIARFIEDRYGQGEGFSYKPWFRVQNVSLRWSSIFGNLDRLRCHFPFVDGGRQIAQC